MFVSHLKPIPVFVPSEHDGSANFNQVFVTETLMKKLLRPQESTNPTKQFFCA